MNQSSKNKKKDSVQGITGISVSGYKSLYEECSIEVRPLTILAGANSSGKSSIMQPLLLLKQTLEATYDPGALRLDGPNVRFTSARQLFSQLSSENHDSFNIKINIDGNKFIANTYKKLPRKEIDITKTICQDDGREVIFWSEMNRQNIITLLCQRLENSTIRNVFLEGKGDLVENLEWEILRERCFLNLTCKSEGHFSIGEPLDISGSIPINLYNSSSHTSLFESHIRQFIHVPGLRGNPERTYKTTAIGSDFIGTFESYVASIVNHWQKTKNNCIKELENALKMLGLTYKIAAKQVDDTQVELQVGRLPYSAKNRVKDMVSIADVGFGVSQILPVLVALLVAEPGQLVYLEQPEIHLHPRAQVALAQVLADAAQRGVKVVIETHSELLLLGVQSLVAEGKLSPDLVKLHWFTRGENGATKVSSAELDDAGAFGDWPEDFGDVSMKLESRYLDAAEARLWKRSHGN